MNSTNRQRTSPRLPLVRLILTSVFIFSLLLVYRLIHPAPQDLSVNQFPIFAFIQKDSVIFLLALAVGSMIGLMFLEPKPTTSDAQPSEFIVTNPVSTSASTTLPEHVMPFEPDQERIKLIPQAPLATTFAPLSR